MAGASTATGVDALGSLYWNPAAISLLPGSEVVIGGELLIPDIHVGSTVQGGILGPFGPAVTQSGRTRSDSGAVLSPGVGVVYRPDGSDLTFGLGLIALALGGVNYPGDANNPILAPTGPFGRGGPLDRDIVLGPQAGSMSILSIMPTVSYQVTDRLAVGFSPMIDFSVVSFDPAFFGPLDNSNNDNLLTFPPGTHSRPFWGAGFRAGLTYRVTDHLTMGLSYTSPQWFETWRFNARTETGEAFEFRTQFTLPMILSMGIAYDGIDRLLLAADVRWFDYRTTDLLGQPVREGGANWDSIWAVALGARYQLSDQLSVQLGYLFNENPISSNLAVFNTQLPLVTQHTVSIGSYFQLNESIGLSMAYVHGFKNSVSGSVFPVLGTSTSLDMEYDSFLFGLHIKFGAPRCQPVAVCESAAPALPR